MKKLFLAAIMATSTFMYAGPNPPGDPVPVDGSVWMLLAAGIGLAAYFGWRKAMPVK